MKYNKVICVGFQKTGTSSLGKALEILGFRTHGPFGWTNENIKDDALEVCLEKAESYDAFQDFPWALLYEEMDDEFPNSKFILTVRNKEEWYESVLSHFGTRSTPMRKWVYGKPFPRWNKEEYINTYEEHIRDVKNYFQGREEDLLVMDITSGDGWDKLCGFLDKEVPQRDFPFSRSRGERRINRIVKYVKNPVYSVKKAAESYSMTIKEIIR